MRDKGKLLLVAMMSAALIGCGASNPHRKIQQNGENLRLELAQTYVAKGARQAAIPLLRKVIAERPRNVKVRVLYASVLRDLGLFPQSRAQFTQALKLSRTSPEVHAGFAILWDLQGNHEHALKYHRRSVKLAPQVAAYRNNLGFSLYLARQTDAAIKQLETALELDPALTIAYNNVGFAYGRRGDFRQAERSFRVTGTRAATLVNMSLVHDEHGDAARATELREEAYSLDPSLRHAQTGGK